MKKWPIYYNDFLTVSNKKCNVGICTLWTPKDSITDKLDKKNFNIGGHLYSKRGINYIIRNVLANPIINKIVLCGSDRSKCGETLIKLKKVGIDKNHKVIGDKKCEIHKEIGKKAIYDFRKNVEIIDLRGEIDPKKIDKVVKQLIEKQKKIKPWAKPRKFKENKIAAADKFPSEKTTFPVRANYIWEAWIQMLRLIMKFGSKKGMIKIGEVKELVNIIAVIDKEDPYDPEISKVFNFTKKDLDIYFKDFFDKDKGSESYNYGERLYAFPVGLPIGEFNSDVNHHKLIADSRKLQAKKGLDQLEEIYEKYKRYHEDRGLIAAIWNPWIDNVKEGWMARKRTSSSRAKAVKKIVSPSRAKAVKNIVSSSGTRSGNVPCMTLLQFTYRSKKLHLTAYFRSNDIFDAWPRNAFALRKLQFDFAKRIGKKPGYLTTISNCAQIYETNYKKANEIVKKFKDTTFCQPDPRSTIIIEVVKNEIIAKHMDPDGNKQLDEYKINGKLEKAALKLMDILQINNIFSNHYQVADIAIELTKAEYCVKNRKSFVQDKDWEELL